MKAYLLQNWSLIATAAMLLVLGAVFLSGCKTAPQETTAHLAVSYATAKYVEKAGANAPARASRVLAVVDAVEGVAGGESVTIDALKAYVLAKLPADLSPADRILAGALVDAAAAELQARVGAGSLDPAALLKVKQVLGWIREGAAPYVK
jgi:hypothetical protein